MTSVAPLQRAVGQLWYGNCQPRVVAGKAAREWYVGHMHPSHRDQARRSVSECAYLRDDVFLITPTVQQPFKHPVSGEMIYLDPICLTLADMEIPDKVETT
jgi:hypothetical protein